MANELIKEKLEKIISNKYIKYDEEMSKHTSFKTGGKADIFITAKNVDDIKKVLKFSKENNVPLYVMGNGSNLLVLDKGIRGIVLKIAIDNIEIDKKNLIVTAGAGTKIMGLAHTLKNEGISGFEELSGVPGTIGGANRMNAGAYGKEIKDIIIETKCIDREGNICVLKRDEQELVYRGSIFKKNKYVILETKMQLQEGNTEDVEKKMKEYSNQRKQKQPVESPSAGSTFKRKEGVITAKLIDECGLKGYSIGGAQVSEKHAGFVINKGNATSADILKLINHIKETVLEKFNIEIEEEIEIIGE